MLAVQRLGGSEIHRDAVLHHVVLFQNLVENRERASPIHHVVFGDDLEPAYYGLPFEDVLVMRNP